MSYKWFDGEVLPPKKTVVLVRLDGHGQKEFIGFHSGSDWFVHDAKKNGVKFPTEVTQWSHGDVD